MRLSKNQLTTIKHTFEEVFGENAALYLFGSRVDDNLKGGDIDLLVDLRGVPLDIEDKLRFQSLLQLRMGDQKIDVVISPNPENDKRLVVQEAVRKGLPL